MGGADLADQAMCYYSVGQKSMKWWRHMYSAVYTIIQLSMLTRFTWQKTVTSH